MIEENKIDRIQKRIEKLEAELKRLKEEQSTIEAQNLMDSYIEKLVELKIGSKVVVITLCDILDWHRISTKI